ncbi:MAG: MCE family protein [Actinomycetales bacterium]|nr:MAG: MCE family protein [Actinomycetales bacterium]
MSGLATSRADAWRLRGQGLLYVAVVAGLVWVSVAAYQKVFTDHITVVVDARRAGAQLNVGGDVRMNGAIVGRVSKVDSSAPGAAVHLQLDRTASRRIPAAVRASIMPTTLFGQKYVELTSADVVRADDHLDDGDHVAEDRSAEAVELTQVVDDLQPVLTAVQPQKLAATLGALSSSLDGRGTQLARTMETATAYLADLNRLTPTFERDLALLRDVSGQYAEVAPDLLAVADDASTTARTLATRSDDLESLVLGLSDVSDAGTRLLTSSRENIRRATSVSRPTLELLAEYSPELVCSLQGFEAARDDAAAQIRGGSVNGEFTITQPAAGYTADDALVNGEVGTGPSCRGLPDVEIPYPSIDLDDGVGPEAAAATGVQPSSLASLLLGGSL